MSYAFTVSRPIVRRVLGSEYRTYKIIETDVSAGDEFEIEGLPTPSTVTIYEAEITDPGGSGVSTLDPEIGIGASFTVGDNSDIGSNDTPAAHIHNQDDLRIRVLPPSQRVRGRSQPDQPNVPKITTQLTVRLGH